MERLDLAAARRPNVSVTDWARGWDALVWHARLAALGAAALVLANVALSPERLWSAWPLAAWSVALLVHAAVVGHAWHASGSRVAEPASDREQLPGQAGAPPVFAADSPTVERPRLRPIPADVVVAAPAPPASDVVIPGAVRVVPQGRREPPAGAHAPSPADVVLGSVALSSPAQPALPGAHRPADGSPARTDPRERQDVAVSVVVLPEDAARSRAATAVPSAPPTATTPGDAPPLPDHVVALWQWGAARPAGQGWSAPSARIPADAPAAPGWPAPGDGAGAW